jgi:hypothetical protein
MSSLCIIKMEVGEFDGSVENTGYVQLGSPSSSRICHDVLSAEGFNLNS